jgi:lipocalin
VACSKDFDNSTVKEFDLSRYLGEWYEIARYDHTFCRGELKFNTDLNVKKNPSAVMDVASSAIFTMATKLWGGILSY